MSALRSIWARLKPDPVTVSNAEKLRSTFAALCGVFVTALASRYLIGDVPLMVAAVGASSVLLFALPTSPLTQPWSVVGSYLISGFVGVTCARWVPNPTLAAAMAVSLAILAMLWARCIHPPGGAVALFAVIGGDAVHALGYRLLLTPALVNALLLVTSALVVNNLLPGRHYPRRLPDAAPPPMPDAKTQGEFTVVHGDVEAAMAEYGHLLDVSGEDIDSIIALTEKRAFRRNFGELNCAAVMNADAPSVRSDAPLLAAWKLLRRHRLPAIAVVDASNRVVGLVGINEFIDRSGARGPKDMRRRLGRFVMHNMARDNTVASVAVPPVITARTEMHIAELIPYFRAGLTLPIPVVNKAQHFVGMVSKSAVIAALFRAHLEHTARS